MRRWLSLVVLLAACSRDLSLPPGNDLALVLPFDTVAPRQKLRLTASGGGGAYVFAFAPNGQRSGTNAVLSSDGAYQAGERGQEQDVVRVTDSSGKFADARITVGPALSITPPLSSVAPGGRIKFVAAGGKPPVRFTRLGVELPDGEYRAGALGNQVDEVVVTDDTNDPLAVARAQISVGSGLVLYPRLASVAPRERLAFVGLGGQPPYLFSLSTSASGGTVAPTIDTTTGVYVAGSHDQGAGDAVDHVVITDANGQVTEALVTVGPGVSLTTVRDRLAPGQSMTAVAAGGKAPYTFSFQARGNHSRATIDAVTGLYVAGPNSGAVDLLQVTDATGSVASCPPVTVGPLEFRVPGGASQIAHADLDGNGQRDLLLLNAATSTVTSVLNGNGQLEQGQLTPDTTLQLVPFDFDDDLRDDVVVPGLMNMNVLRTNFAGRFSLGTANGLGAANYSRGARLGPWFYRHASSCGLERLSLPSLTSTSPLSQCMTPLTGVSFAVGATEVSSGPVTWRLRRTTSGGAAGTQPAATGPIEFQYLLDAADGGSPTLSRSAQLPFPPGHRATELTRASVATGINVVVDEPTRVGAARMLMLIHDADSGVGKLWGIDAETPRESMTMSALPTTYPAAGIAVQTLDSSGEPLVAAWDSRSGKVPVLRVANDGGVRVGQEVEFGFPVTAAAFIDLDVDGLEDLVTTSLLSETTAVTWADGNGSFGRRVRYSVDAFDTRSLFDLDNDGATDLVTSAAGRLQVFWGSAMGSFAVGPMTSISRDPVTLIVSQFGRAAPDVIFCDTVGELFLSEGDGTGSFAAPRPFINSAGGVDVGLLGTFQPAEFGGAASGPDLLSSVRDPVLQVSVAAVLVRNGPTVVDRTLVPPPPATNCTYRALDVDGQGSADLIAACAGASNASTRVFTSRSSGTGRSLSFAPWIEYGTGVAGAAQHWAVTSGEQHFLVTSSSVTEFKVANGNLSSTTRALPVSLNFVMIGPLVVGSPDPVVIGNSASTLEILSWNGTAYVRAQSVSSGDALPIGFAHRTAAGPLDVIVSRPGLAIPLTNDGAGRLR